MRFEEFGALVARYEAEAALDPAGYPGRVQRLVWLGRLYIVCVPIVLLLALALSVVVGTVHVMGMLCVMASVGYAIRSAFRAMAGSGGAHEPQRVLTREEAPGLFEVLDGLGGRVDSVELVPQFNAAMVYIPRLGLLGWPRHHLVLGMSLLLSLSEEEARAVIAHELGHMTGAHGERTSGLYAQRTMWANLRDDEEQDELSRALFKPLWTWILPRFNAMSFVLARMQEYEADAFAAAATSEEIAAAALVRVHVDDNLLDREFWDVLFKSQREREEPPRDVYTQIARRFEQPRDPEVMRALLEEALAAQTSVADTHPCLRERLEALGAAGLGGLNAAVRSAAQAWFADLPGQLARLDASFFEEMSAQWAEGRQTLLARERMLGALERGEEDEELEGASELMRSRLHAALLWRRGERPEEAMRLLREHVERFPEDARGHLNLGYAMLEGGDEEGIERLRDGVRRDVRFGGEIGAVIMQHYLGRQALAEADVWRDKLERWERDMAMMRGQWGRIGPEVEFEPAGLGAEVSATLIEAFARFPKVRRVWLVRKVDPPYFPDEPIFLLAFTAGLYSLEGDAALTAQIAETISFSAGLHIRDVTPWSQRELRLKLEAVEGGRLF